ncbi:MAG: ACP S-malonyltransferase [Candidatus Marinimicrobia bacterium]|nr:ACP S-malonyltransferase [Candidatus Neomarinimicrobiota bacterium]MCF7830102.1 ACP S-malonyltransferase [Candidatus Neomarinimicrobiota bacterium]MCF7882149.1 ACP S-malonyltransferase [Candidatus Neomarinimicrobiota bacterium]
MGKDLYESFDLANEYYTKADEILGIHISKLSFEGPLEKLTETHVTQPAIFTLSVILHELLSRENASYSMVAGHSLGEYSALVAAGVMDFETGLHLVKTRSQAMQAACESRPGTMAAIIGLEEEKVAEACSAASNQGIVQPANYNSPGQIAISGEVDAVRAAMEQAKEMGARRAIELVVGGAFHSPLMGAAKIAMQEALEDTSLQDAAVPVYVNKTGNPLQDAESIKQALIDQIDHPVLWMQTIENMIEDGADSFVEVGPGTVLTGLMRRINKEVESESVSSYRDIIRFEE